MGEKRNAYSVLVGKPEGKRPLGRPRCRWVDNIKLDLREIGWDGKKQLCEASFTISAFYGPKTVRWRNEEKKNYLCTR
jgi:hypothetical protein